MNLFYTQPNSVTSDTVRLTGQEAKHASKVLRIRIRDTVHITNGTGNLYTCSVSEITKSEVICKIQEKQFEERNKPFVTLIVGLVKKRDRLEFAVEKSVELGADEIVVFRGDHSEKGNVRLERLESTALSAMKQSLRVYLPKITFSENLTDALKSTSRQSRLIYADETLGEVPTPIIDQDSYVLVVGPEGGFSEEERKVLNKEGGVPYSLGDKRLRTETAAVTVTDRYKNGLI